MKPFQPEAAGEEMSGLPMPVHVRLQDQEGVIGLRSLTDGLHRGDGISFQVLIEPQQTGAEIEIQLELATPRHIEFVGIELPVGAFTSRQKFFGTTPGFLERQGVSTAVTARDEERTASMIGIFIEPDSTSILAGIGAPHPDPSVFSLGQSCFRAGFAPKRELSGFFSFRLCLLWGADPLELLQNYGRRLAVYARPFSNTPTGWNSWDFYGGSISMTDVEAEMAALSRWGGRSGLTYLSVDMGWEGALGDWSPNRKFPKSLSKLAERILAKGWRPGIWTAPLLVSIYTALARNRQELFLRDGNGSLVIDAQGPYGPVLLLDFSLAEVRELVGSWFSSMRKAGFELFKVDYIYEEHLQCAAHNAGRLGKVAFSRSIFQTIREAVGSGAHVINCGASKEAVLGLVDSCRVTVDIHNFWGHVRHNARQLAHTFWVNRNCWVNDPDFAIVRNTENCSARYKNMPYVSRPEGPLDAVSPQDFWMRGPEARTSEMRIWLSAVRLNGGSLFLADSFRTLNEAGRRDLEKLFPPLETSFVPFDLFERDRPGIWLSQDRNRPTLGLFNWEDSPDTLELPAALGRKISARDFWTGRRVDIPGIITLAPRSGVLLDL